MDIMKTATLSAVLLLAACSDPPPVQNEMDLSGVRDVFEGRRGTLVDESREAQLRHDRLTLPEARRLLREHNLRRGAGRWDTATARREER